MMLVRFTGRKDKRHKFVPPPPSAAEVPRDGGGLQQEDAGARDPQEHQAVLEDRQADREVERSHLSYLDIIIRIILIVLIVLMIIIILTI